MGDFMEYAQQLPPFDPELHLTGADLRQVEKGLGYESMVQPDRDSADKVTKASYETRLMAQACARFKTLSAEHPPYGLSAPLENPMDIVGGYPVEIAPDFLTEEETAATLEGMPLKGVQALSDLKLQLILNDLLREAFASEDFAKAMPAARSYTLAVTAGRIDNWKATIQSTASNAKRSEFIVLKHIVIQWMKQMGRLPTREEFVEVATESEQLLETLATTHQEVFRVLNVPLIQDEHHQRYHVLVNRNGKGQLAVDRSIFQGLKIHTDQPKVRTMCPAMLVKDDDGMNLLQRSYREDVAMVTDMLFEGDTPRAERFESIPKERLPQQSVHMYLRLRKLAAQ